MTGPLPDPDTNDDLIADIFHGFVDDLQDGRTVQLDALIQKQPELEKEIREAWELASNVAARKTRVLPTFEGYEILRELGQGGMGTVYLARQKSLGREVALKVLPPAVCLSANGRQRFLDEARALAPLHNDHIVKIHDIIERDDALAYAMEWVEGKSLKQILDELRPHGRNVPISLLSECLGTKDGGIKAANFTQYLVKVGIDIARALETVHQTRMVHRDVKPSNILIRRNGSPLLADFGLARGSDTTLTLTGAFVGTPVYAPPEQLRSSAFEPLDGRTDVYALGVTLYEAIAFVQPFAGKNTVQILRKIENGEIRRLHSYAPEVPRDLETILAKAMESNVKDRYASAAEFADDLERLLRLEPIQARPASMARRFSKFVRRHRRPLLAGTISALAVGATIPPMLEHQRYRASIPSLVASYELKARTHLLSPESGKLAWAQLAYGRHVLPPSLTAGKLGLFEALENYDKALEHKPDNETLRLERNVVFLVASLLPQGDSGVEHLELTNVAKEIGPVLEDAVKQLADGEMELELDPQAVAQTSAEDRKGLGLLAYLIGDYSLCELAWKDLDSVSAKLPLVDAALGILYHADGRPSRAYPRLLRAHQSFQKAPFLRINLADTALSLQDVEMAEHLVGNAEASLTDADWTANLQPTSQNLLRRVRADLMVAKGQQQPAREEYEQLLLHRPPYQIASLRLAQLDLANGEQDSAIQRLQTLVAQAPRVARFRLVLAQAALQAQDLPLYLEQAVQAVAWDYGVDRSPGTIRDLHEILRIGGLQRLYREGLALTNFHPPLSEVGFPRYNWKNLSPVTSTEGAESLIEHLANMRRDATQIHTYPDTNPAVQRSAQALSIFSRVTYHFPSLYSIVDGPSQLALRYGAIWSRQNWQKEVIPGIQALLDRPSVVDAQHHIYTIYGPAAGHDLSDACHIGDVNKDGCSDFLVAAFNDGSGYAKLISGRDGKVIYEFQGEHDDESFAVSSAGAGDTNRDGYPDIIIGASKGNYAKIYSGLDGSTLHSLQSEILRGGFGSTVDGAGDVNADGYGDVIVGAFLANYARVHSGKDGSILHTLPGNKVTDSHGVVASAGDVDKDGYADFMVGAFTAGQNWHGEVKVYSGRLASSELEEERILHRFVGRAPGEMIGTSLCSPGDINADSYPDFLISGRTAANLYSGRDGQLLQAFTGDPHHPLRRTVVGSAGDINLDGVPDLLLASRQQFVSIYSGKTGRPLHTFFGQPSGLGFGFSVHGAGDVNQDGFPDILVGASLNNRNGEGAGCVHVLSGRKLELTTDVHEFSLASKNTQTLYLDAGRQCAGYQYLLLGSMSGTQPGSSLGSVHLPLNQDVWTRLSLELANSPLLRFSKGHLNSMGQAVASIHAGPIAHAPQLVGRTIHHAFLAGATRHMGDTFVRAHG